MNRVVLQRAYMSFNTIGVQLSYSEINHLIFPVKKNKEIFFARGQYIVELDDVSLAQHVLEKAQFS